MQHEEATPEALAEALMTVSNATAEAMETLALAFGFGQMEVYQPPKRDRIGLGLSNSHMRNWPKDYRRKSPRPSRALRHAIRSGFHLSNHLTGSVREVWIRYLYR